VIQIISNFRFKRDLVIVIMSRDSYFFYRFRAPSFNFIRRFRFFPDAIEKLTLPVLIILPFVDLSCSAVTDGKFISCCVSEISFWILTLKNEIPKFLNQTAYDYNKFNKFKI
jgi:hypothetical protein